MARRTKSEIEKRKSGDSGLWIAAIAGIVGLIVGMLFLSQNITGNAAGTTGLVSNIIGTALFITGLVGSFFWLRSH